ncbi:MAG TPA: hypothetical protein DEA71_16985 [Nitrospira sp.]|nr:hypothetical protein [Nitrospira sp.]
MDYTDWIDSAIAAIGNMMATVMMATVRRSILKSHRNTTLFPNEWRQSIDWLKRRHLEQRMHGPRPACAITTSLSWSSSGQEIGADFFSHEAYMLRHSSFYT